MVFADFTHYTWVDPSRIYSGTWRSRHRKQRWQRQARTQIGKPTGDSLVANHVRFTSIALHRAAALVAMASVAAPLSSLKLVSLIPSSLSPVERSYSLVMLPILYKGIAYLAMLKGASALLLLAFPSNEEGSSGNGDHPDQTSSWYSE